MFIVSNAICNEHEMFKTKWKGAVVLRRHPGNSVPMRLETLSRKDTLCLVRTIAAFIIAILLFNNSAGAANETNPKSFYDAGKWFSNPVAGISSAAISQDSIILRQKGALTHQNQWIIQKMSFDIQFDNSFKTGDPYLFILQFAKARRNSFYGETHNRGAINDSYGLVFSKEGRVFPVRFGKEREMKIISDDFAAIDLSTKNSIEFHIEYVHDAFSLKLKANNDSFFTFTDETHFDHAGYVTLLNIAVGLETHLSNMVIDAVEIAADESSTPMPVYFLDYFESSRNKMIHWRYNERTQDYTGVDIYEGEKLLANLSYPEDRFILPGSVVSDDLMVKSVDIDGDKSEASVVKLHADESLLATDIPPRIRVKQGTPYAQLVKKQANETFNIRGVNYVRLTFGDHSNFTAKNQYLPDLYDPYDTETMLRTLKKHGYNTVRVFLTSRGVMSSGIGGDPEFDEPVYTPYLDNFVDFLSKAKKYGIYVLPTFGDGDLPLNIYYRPLIQKMVEQTGEQGQLYSGIPYNSVYLTEPGIQGRTILITETLKYIKQQDPTLLKSILAVQCQNELSLRANQWPFSLSSGRVITANGQTYDMADTDSRQRCMDEGLNYYHQTLIRAIKAIDSELLVAEGVFTLRIVGKDPVKNKGLNVQEAGDQRFPPTAVVMGQSGLDLIDIHIYHVNKDETPADGYRKDMDSMLMVSDRMKDIRSRIPIIMGEFGAFRFIVPSPDQARANILATRDACLEDHLNGFMIWTLDTFEQQEMHHTLDGGNEFLSELRGR